MQVIIAPHDPCRIPLQSHSTQPAWTVDLYKKITEAFIGYIRQSSPTQRWLQGSILSEKLLSFIFKLMKNKLGLLMAQDTPDDRFQLG